MDEQSKPLDDAGNKDDFGNAIAPIPSNTHGLTAEFKTGGLNDVEQNLKVIEEAVEAIGFGKFHWQLSMSCGFGFLADQMLLVSISLVGPQLTPEFAPTYPTLLPASNYAGLLVGAIAMVAIDLTILAENIPRRWSFMLAGLACVWGLGNSITGFLRWGLLVNFGCPQDATPSTCPKSANMGWRYLYITLGGLCLIMSIIRAVVIRMHESPRWLVSCGRVDEAVEVVNRISSMNRSEYTVTAAQFVRTTRQQGDEDEVVANHGEEEAVAKTQSLGENLRRAARLFEGWAQVRLMICLTLLWMLVGIADPLFTLFLPYYLRAHGADLNDSSNYTTYRDWAITSVVGIFGPALSMWMVSNSWLRSRKSLVLTGAACAAFSAAFTSVKNQSQNLAFSCMISFWLNAMYAINYAYTPQALSVENRGLGNGLLMAVGQFASLSSPFIATFADVSTPAPIWVACGCFAMIGVVGLVLPVDTIAYNQAE
ncbi:major facilitator superfamily domain-containing protein [Colletotrichum phormii]|uniref:Major facilitator superfamily domain-containing protein n=1 Tax=Colletotrichum phormii TaxID=359342 RepID=A0AAJ0EFZ3_9PEZI|nr:major facilitator superfamily domain-containing protein [Colletotrichum phormii]KAK1637553.1 major facilitator superfamily domain-containing protein [Colletotrichum phormii]